MKRLLEAYTPNEQLNHDGLVSSRVDIIDDIQYIPGSPWIHHFSLVVAINPQPTRPSTSGHQILGEGRRAWPRLELDGLLGLGGFRVEAEAVARLFCTCCAMERLRGGAPTKMSLVGSAPTHDMISISEVGFIWFHWMPFVRRNYINI